MERKRIVITVDKAAKDAFDYWQAKLGLPSNYLSTRVQDFIHQLNHELFEKSTRQLQLPLETEKVSLSTVTSSKETVHESPGIFPELTQTP